MMKPWKIIQELEADNSRLKKRRLLSERTTQTTLDSLMVCVWR